MNKITIVAALLLSSLMMSCTTDSMEEINTGYNSVNEVKYLYLINSTLSDLTQEEYQVEDWIQHTAYYNYPMGLYDHRASTTPWMSFYVNNVNLREVLELTQEQSNPEMINARAMALIIRSYQFMRLTDAYGDVPYSEAGAKIDGIVIAKPVYDSQESIYRDCFANLTEAIELIGNDANIELGEADYIYYDDLQKWKLFANSVRLRMALRVSNVDASLSNQWFAEVAKYPLINSHDEEARYENFDEEGYRNPMYSTSEKTNHPAKLFVDYLQDNNDPRMLQFMLPSVANGDYVGLENGQSFVAETANYSHWGSELTRVDRPTPILLYNEVCMIKAEMYLRGMGGVAQDLIVANDWYQKGIIANMEYYNVATEDIDTFMTTEAEANLNGSEENMKKQIGYQKWLANIRVGHEAFADALRSGYPAIVDRTSEDVPAVSLGETNGVMPRRLKYPDDEMYYNEDNYNAAVAATNGNSYLSRVWWDVN